MHLLEKEIILNRSAEQIWQFMATPGNLNELTPPDLKFHIVSKVPAEMYNGLIIEYRITIPWFGTWLWLTEIKHIREGEYFVDEQRIGPYRLWYHEHRIEALDDQRTRMTDRVSYCLPFGIIGRIVHKYYVKKMLQDIFAYRSKRLEEIFT